MTLRRTSKDTAWFRVGLGTQGRVIVMGLARGRAEWQAYRYEESPAP